VIDIPPVVGDPAAIRAFADQLRGAAARLEGLEAEVASTPGSMTFEGPAADEFGERMRSLASRVGAAAAALRGVAGRVDAAAEEVARRIEARERLLEELRRQAAAAAAGAS
jgi:uncharacterized protein YukE